MSQQIHSKCPFHQLVASLTPARETIVTSAQTVLGACFKRVAIGPKIISLRRSNDADLGFCSQEAMTAARIANSALWMAEGVKSHQTWAGLRGEAAECWERSKEARMIVAARIIERFVVTEFEGLKPVRQVSMAGMLDDRDPIEYGFEVFSDSFSEAISRGLSVAKQSAPDLYQRARDLAAPYILVRYDHPTRFTKEGAFHRFLSDASKGGLAAIWGLLGVVPEITPKPASSETLADVARNSFEEMVMGISALHLHAGIPVLERIAAAMTRSFGIRHNPDCCTFEANAVWIKPEILRGVEERVLSGKTNIHDQLLSASRVGPQTGCPARFVLNMNGSNNGTPRPFMKSLFEESLAAAKEHIYQKQSFVPR